MKLVLFIALIIACAFAVQNTSQSTMQTTGPADVLLDHLGEIQTDIREEQNEHDQLYNQQSAECEEEYEAREEAIEEAEDALARSTQHLARCEASGKEAEADIAQANAYITEINGILQQKAITRQEQAADHKTLIEDELQPAIKAVEGAFPIIDQFVNGSAGFSQVAQHMGSSFKTLVKAGKGAAMAAPLAALAEMSQEFDQEAIQRVRTLFQNLKNDLVAAVSAANDLEQQRIQVYNDTVEEYNAILENLNATVEELTAYAAEMEACVVQETNIVEQAGAKLENNKAALAYAIQMCEAFEREYQDASAGRRTELQLLEKLVEFINEQAEIFGDYGADSSGVFESYRSQYESAIQSQVDDFIQLRKEKNSDHAERMKKAISVI